MAVIVKYVVVRDGKEDMIFTTKKEADAYDKMLTSPSSSTILFGPPRLTSRTNNSMI